MPFKLDYNFEGNHRARPEQNLSGSSRKQSRDVLLQRAHEERQKRQDQRLKLRSAEILQSHVRSYLVRQRKKNEERFLFDQMQNSNEISELLRKFLFFYDSTVDQERLIFVCNKLLIHCEAILKRVEVDTAFGWLVKRILIPCMKFLGDPTLTDVLLNCLDVFSVNAQVLKYLVIKGYFRYLSNFLNCISENDPMVECVLGLIHRPFACLKTFENEKVVILSEFCESFLCPTITRRLKEVLIPFLRSKSDFPYSDIIRYLKEYGNCSITNSLFYCIIALEPDDFAPSLESLQVLSNLSKNIHQIKPEPVPNSDDSDVEEVIVTPEEMLTEDYVHILNSTDRVKKIVLFFYENSENEDVLTALTHFCHNLLMIHKSSMKKFMLLYMLSLQGTFLIKLWGYIKRHESMHSSRTSDPFAAWRDNHRHIAVFCDMFTFYNETLTDTESTDTSGTFSSDELLSMSELLKTMALQLIDIAFPMYPSGAVTPTPEVLNLYNTCLKSVLMLHMLDLRKKFCPAAFWTKTKINISLDLVRKNYLSKTIRPFYGIVKDEEDDEHLPPLSTVQQRSLAILQQLPFLVEFNTRVLLLRVLCLSSKGGEGMQLRDFMADSFIVIRRTHLYEDAFEKLSPKSESDLRKSIRIQFINSAGLEEAGIDGGGVYKEFLNEVLKTAFDPIRGFFLLTADNMLYPNPNVHLIVENYAQHYFFIGQLIGKAIFENILVDLPLAEFFLAKILVDRASAHYLKSLDPLLYRNLLYLRDYTGDVQDLGLDFTYVTSDLGEVKVVDLKPNGRNIPVTNYNRLEYIHRLADLKLNSQIKKQCAAFREGLDSVVPLLWLRLFNHNELQVIVGGDMQEIDLSDLREHTVYGGEFTVDHPTILLFWKVVQEFTEYQKKQLLKFVTSCSRPPLLGFKELNPLFCIQSSGNEDRMPTASTCLNLLKVPIIKDEEVLRSKLLSAIEQQAGFELS